MYDKSNLKNIPKRPGIYIQYNHAGDVIYVGKAKNLFNRVHQYFQNPERLPLKTRLQVSHIEKIETIVVDTEMEALILECNLIKKYKPRYNIMLKDDKSYPYIKVTTQQKYPKLFMTREHKRDGGKYFGPFTNVTAVHQTIEALRKIYPLRRCNKKVAYGVRRGRPCMYYHIGQCDAPCTGKLKEADYQKNVDAVLDILGGKDKEVIARLKKEMTAASEALDFETAAKKRDQIKGIEFVVSKQKIISENQANQDFVAFATEDVPKDVGTDMKAVAPEDEAETLQKAGLACVQIFNVRDGKLLGRHHAMIPGGAQTPPDELMSIIVKQYYGSDHIIPKEIVLASPMSDDESAAIVLWLEKLRGGPVTITVPQKGRKKQFIDMVKQNAELTLSQYLLTREHKKQKSESRMDSLKDLIGIDKVPRRIEAYDISNISGSQNVGGMVVFIDGKPAPKAYRRFKIKTIEGQNDYGSMQEMLFRRVEHGMREKKAGVPEDESAFLPFPEIFMIDGGKTHVEAAQAILSMYPEIDSVVCGLVKDDHHQLRGLIYGDEEYHVAKGTPLSTFLNEISEEVHRYAIGYHRKLRKKNMLASTLDEIPGIGVKRRESLMRYFGTIEAIKNASAEELIKVDGMNAKSADAVVDYFKQDQEKRDDEQRAR